MTELGRDEAEKLAGKLIGEGFVSNFVREGESFMGRRLRITREVWDYINTNYKIVGPYENRLKGSGMSEREQFLADIITTAVEGGTGYWAQVSDYVWDCPPAEARATLHDMQDGKAYLLNPAAVERGIDRLNRGDVQVSAALRKAILYADVTNDGGGIDADDADIITQAGLLGEVVYG